MTRHQNNRFRYDSKSEELGTNPPFGCPFRMGVWFLVSNRRAPIKRPLEVYPAAPRAQNCSELKNAAQPRFATLAPPLNDGESKTLFQAKEHWARCRDGARGVT